MFTIDVANTIFVICFAVGGVLLLLTVLLDDVFGSRTIGQLLDERR